MEYIISAVLISVEIFSLNILMSSFFEKKVKGVKGILVFILAICSMCWVFNLPMLKSNTYIRYMASIVFNIIIFKLCKKITTLQAFLITIIWYVIYIATEFFTLQIYFNVFKLTQPIFMSSMVHFITLSTLARVEILLLSLLFNKWYTKNYKNIQISRKECLLIAIYPLSTTAIIISTAYPADTLGIMSNSQLFILGLIITSNFILFYLLGNINLEKIKNQENIILQERIKSTEREKNILQKSYQKQRSMTHDFNNNLDTIKNIIEVINVNDTSVEILKRYVGKLLKNSEKISAVVKSNNIVVDAILNQKYIEALKLGVATSFEITDLSKLEIAENDLVTILTNAIDNAISASSKTEEKLLKIRITNIEGELIICVTNSINSKIAIENNSVKTTKEDTLNSGYGINNIKRALSNYEHIFSLRSTEKEFHLSILI